MLIRMFCRVAASAIPVAAALSMLPALPACARDVRLRPWPAAMPTPPLALENLDGTPWTLAALRGKVVVVNFWASWCEPCVDELPVLGALARRDGVAVVGVNYKENADAIGRFVSGHPIPYTVLRDRTGAPFKAWSPGVMPTTVLVDRRGRARWRSVGEIPADDTRLRAAIDALLAEPNH